MNLATILESHPGDSPAIISRGRTFTYADLRAQIASLRGALHEIGIGKGDRL
ncbi:MAG: hypothetical protein EB111_05785, partial [Actinobacteria bacterium]|nr:hypothetical protein [Actinomycetota bacterium]